MKNSIILGVCAVALGSLGCKGGGSQESGEALGESAEVIVLDGSSTVFPISQAVAEDFQSAKGGQVTIGVSGTGGGFKKFCRGDIAITGASRPIKPSEVAACEAAGIEFVELPIAYDGLAVVVHPANDWAGTMTVAELKTVWAPEAADKITRWSQVRPGWPDTPLHLFAPGVDSGTYDYFTKAIVGVEHASRGDFTSSEDDNVLVQGVSTDPSALGFFGYAYYAENRDKLKIVPIDDGDPANGEGGIEPTPVTIADGSYQPLSRPVFLYVSTKAAERPEVAAFVDFYLGEGRKLVAEVGYVPLPDSAYGLVQERFSKRVVGSLFEDGSKVGVSVDELLRSP